METLLVVIGELVRAPITRDILERTRLGRDIKDIRKVNKGSDLLNKKAKDLVKKWRAIVQEEESNIGPSPPNLINTNSNGSTHSSTSSFNGHPNNKHIPNNKQARRLLTSQASSPRPGTAPASPALSTSYGRDYKSRHSAPSSPALSSLRPQNGQSGVQGPLQVPNIAAITPGLIREHNKHSSRANAAHKRLRKEEAVIDLDTIEEPPPKRQRYEAPSPVPPAVTPCVKPMSNGIIQVEDDDIISVGSSSGGSCEVIDISKASNYRNNKYSSKNMGSIYPQTPVLPYPIASEGSSLPGASLKRSDQLETSSQNSIRTDSPDIIIQSSITPNNKSNSNVPSSARSGRGRGRRRSATLQTAPSIPVSDIKLTKSKVKTTSQLVAELAQRRGDTLLAQRATKLEQEQQMNKSTIVLDDDMTLNKIDHVHRYVQSLPSPHRNSPVAISPPPPSSSPEIIIESPTPKEDVEEMNPFAGNLDRIGVKDNETAEQLLARLPPIDYEAARLYDIEESRLDQLEYGHTEDGAEKYTASILRSQSRASNASEKSTDSTLEETAKPEEEVPTPSLESKPTKLLDEGVIERLHSCHQPGLNGNMDSEGQFKAWYDVLTEPSYLEQPLQILPYTILDF